MAVQEAVAAPLAAVENVVFDWVVLARSEVDPTPRVMTFFAFMVNDRAQSLGGTPASIRARIQGDIGVARAQLGAAEFLDWR